MAEVERVNTRRYAAFILSTIILFSLVFGGTALATDANPSFTAPNNGNDFTFSVPIQVSETERYAGIQFKLTPSSQTNLSYTFSLGADVTAKGAQKYAPVADPYSFGFYSNDNVFSGDLMVGTLTFTYKGNAPQNITIDEMMIIRLDENANQQWVIKPSPVQIISVSREGGGNGDGSDDSGGSSGSGGGGGSGSENIGDGGTPLTMQLPFDDVQEGDWFYNDVVYAYANGLMTGTSATKFSPNISLTRGMIVTILGRQANVDQSKYPSCAFSDVADNIYFTPYVEWSRQNGIVLGVGNNRFLPDREVTRQELAAILHRYADFAGITLPVTQPFVQFLDEKEIAAYAKDPVQALCSAGVINGKPGNRFDPIGTATRAEAAAMLHRFLLAAGA